MALPTIGTITYNNFTFNSTTRSRITARPIYDKAERTIVAVVWTFNLTTYVSESSPGAGCDDVVADLRQRLMSPGRSFIYSGKGFGPNFAVNQGAVKDVLWGPKPVMLDLEPIGSKSIYRVTWACEVAIPECTTAQYSKAPMAFNYETSFAIDADGYTIRQISGYVEIPMTRSFDGARNVPDSADKYREQIKWPIPEGFRRTQQTFSVSADKRRMDFVIVDEENPTDGMPEGCTMASGMQTASSAQAGLRNWTGRLSASYIVAKGRSRQLAYEAFFALVQDRLEATRRATNKSTETKDSVIPYALEITQGLYLDSRRLSFSLAYAFVLPLKEIMEGTGIWREVPKTDATKWAASIEKVTGLRGYAGLKDDPSQDMIIDLCGGASPGTEQRTDKPVELKGTKEEKIKQGGYITFQQAIDVEERPGIGAMIALPAKTTAETRASLALGSFSATHNGPPQPGPELGEQPRQRRESNGTDLMYGLLTGEKDGIVGVPGKYTTKPPPPRDPPKITPGESGGLIPQVRTAPIQTIRLRGYAVALGQAITCPSLDKFEDATLIPHPIEEPRFTTRTLGFLLNMPLVHGEWVVPYLCVYPNGARRPQ